MDSRAGGGDAPRSAVPRAARVLGRLLVTAVVLGAILALLGNLPEGTGARSLTIRAATGLAIGGVIVVLVRRSMRSLTNPPPPAPPPVDARAVDVVYECVHCATRLRLEVAATGKPPRHCGEEMEPRLEAPRA